MYTILTVTANGNSVEKGDLILGLPDKPGFELYDYARTYGKCDQLSRESCTPFTMAGYVAAQAILQVGPGGVLNDLSTTSSDLSLGDLITPLMQQLPQVLLYGKQVAALAANSTLLNNIAKFLLLAVYAEITTPAPNPTRLIIPASDMVTSTQVPQATGQDCPAQVPNCSNCGGNKIPPTQPVNTDGICVGLAKLKDNYPEGCVCVHPNGAPPNAPFGSMEEIDEAVSFLASVSADAINSTSITTSTTSASSSSITTRPCSNNGIKYINAGACDENCPGGKCTPVEMKARRCEGCNNGPQIDYLCTCQ